MKWRVHSRRREVVLRDVNAKTAEEAEAVYRERGRVRGTVFLNEEVISVVPAEEVD